MARQDTLFFLLIVIIFAVQACQPQQSETCTADGCANIDKSCALDPPPMANYVLLADGTAIRDALGRRVLLRGVNASGRAKMPPFAPFDTGNSASPVEAEFQKIFEFNDASPIHSWQEKERSLEPCSKNTYQRRE